jgi:hypothetical protein
VSAAAGTLGGSATAGDNGGVFTDGKYIKGVPILRTTGYSRFDRSTGNLLNADANQAAAREGITNFLVDSQTAYTAARMDRNTRGQLTSEYTQSAIRGGSAAQGTAAGSGVTNLWSNAAGALKMGSNTRRAELAGDRTAAAIRVRCARAIGGAILCVCVRASCVRESVCVFM